KEIFSELEPKDIESLQKTGRETRELILKAEFPKDLSAKILKAYKKLSRKYGEGATDVAVRSSATAEDLATASFAGQMETFLNIRGEEELLRAVKKCIASLFTDRSIAYREQKGFDHLKIALSVGVQKMVRSDKASSGIMFTLDTETGFENVVLINSIWGVGEMIVQGKITPDEFYVFKPTLKKGFKSIIVKNLGRKNLKYVYGKEGGLREERVSLKDHLRFSLEEKEVLILAKWAMLIQDHYGKHMDMEWAKDGLTKKLFIVQARPETVHIPEENRKYIEYDIKTKQEPVLNGIAVGDKIGIGKVRVISDVSKMNTFKEGEVLVTKMTDPDWVPLMRLAKAIVTDEGGKTCHAAIIARELGVPTIVGTREATTVLKTGQMITVDCTQGLKGRIFEGEMPFEKKEYDLKKVPKLKTKITMNIGAPDIAFKTSFLPNDGVGLAREEFIIAEKIKVHPLALYHFKTLKDKKLKKKINDITVEHKDKREYFVKELSEGVSQIAAAFYPKEVIVRFSDFKTNEYKNLVGGALYEGEEENTMLGFRGASRYVDESFQPAFRMECQAIKRAREVFGLDNISVMVPFCRTVEEGEKVKKLITKFGLARQSSKSEGGLKEVKVYVMCEIPANVVLIDQFLDIFDGMSIGSNDLTQLMVGLDRDNARIAHITDERNEAVKKMISKVIKACKKRGKYVGICGQAPSDFTDFAEFLQEEGIDSMSLNPDTVIKTIMALSGKDK
ncbi:MAG: phosphoenolpyruvate synthase, partial [bacterium]|nr:phosphoenolpyruvate synthase [bacterium]